MMHPAIPLTLGALALAACAAPQPVSPVADGYRAEVRTGGLAVTRDGQPFGNFEGAEAKRAANRLCGGNVRSSIRDRFEDGTWIFVEGCA